MSIPSQGGFVIPVLGSVSQAMALADSEADKEKTYRVYARSGTGPSSVICDIIYNATTTEAEVSGSLYLDRVTDSPRGTCDGAQTSDEILLTGGHGIEVGDFVTHKEVSGGTYSNWNLEVLAVVDETVTLDASITVADGDELIKQFQYAELAGMITPTNGNACFFDGGLVINEDFVDLGCYPVAIAVDDNLNFMADVETTLYNNVSGDGAYAAVGFTHGNKLKISSGGTYRFSGSWRPGINVGTKASPSYNIGGTHTIPGTKVNARLSCAVWGPMASGTTAEIAGTIQLSGGVLAAIPARSITVAVANVVAPVIGGVCLVCLDGASGDLGCKFKKLDAKFMKGHTS